MKKKPGWPFLKYTLAFPSMLTITAISVTKFVHFGEI